MLIDLIESNLDFKEILIRSLLMIPIVLISLSLHEMSHGYIADRLGDPTAKNLGRVTMNPFKHFDLIGTICMLLVGIGWAKPVPINAVNFKDPKKGMALTGLAGPVSNLLLAFAGDLILHIFLAVVTCFTYTAKAISLLQIIYIMLYMLVYMNVYLAVFNLLPIPPFDGSRILYAFLPDRIYFGLMKYERIIMMIVLILLWTNVISLPFSWLAEKIILIFDFIIELVPFL